MKSYPVSTLRPGMAFTKEVYIGKDDVLLKPNEVLSDADIERLNKWKITEVMSDGQLVKASTEKKSNVSNAESAAIHEVIKELRNAVKSGEAFQKFISEGEKLLEDAYDNLSKEIAIQLSPIRNLAEEAVRLIEGSPMLPIFAGPYHRSNSLYRHTLMTSFYAALLGNALGMSSPRNIEVVMATLLMDVGMRRVPKEILEKDSRLTDAEKQQLQAHPLVAYQLLTQTAKIKNQLALVALEHHEHFDGSGYPRKIKGENMSEASRIAAIADSYCALLEPKSYRKTKIPYEAMKELISLGIYRYDPQMLKEFLNRLSIYPIGSLVKLSDESLGVVVSPSAGKPMRPIILLLRTGKGAKPVEPSFVHLLHNTDKYIVSSHSSEDLGMNLTAELLEEIERMKT